MTNPVVEVVPVGSLTPNPDNPRILTDERFESLKHSLSTFPQVMHARPVITNLAGVIAGGNQRYRAAIDLGWTEIPVVKLDLSDEDFAVIALADNNQWGEWDDQLLAEQLYGLSVDEVDVSLAGFDDDELARLLASVSGGEFDPSGELDRLDQTTPVTCPECGHEFHPLLRNRS